jgi:hypothetical protein
VTIFIPLDDDRGLALCGFSHWRDGARNRDIRKFTETVL